MKPKSGTSSFAEDMGLAHQAGAALALEGAVGMVQEGGRSEAPGKPKSAVDASMKGSSSKGRGYGMTGMRRVEP